MIRSIAAADYGRDFDAHLSELTHLWQGNDWEELGVWYPMEVLELIRWSEPDEAADALDSERTEGHCTRAFCCAALLVTSNFEPEKETLIQLVDSAFAIGGRVPDAVARFLSWKLPLLGREDDKPFFALALAAIARIEMDELTREQEASLAEWIAAEENSERRYLSSYSSSYQEASWLFGLSWSDMRSDRWVELIVRLQEGWPGAPLAILFKSKSPQAVVRRPAANDDPPPLPDPDAAT